MARLKQQPFSSEILFKTSLKFYLYVWFPTHSPQDSSKQQNLSLCICTITSPSPRSTKDGFLYCPQICWDLQARQQGYCGVPTSTACLLGLVVGKGHFEVIACTPKGTTTFMAFFRRAGVSPGGLKTRLWNVSSHSKP